MSLKLEKPEIKLKSGKPEDQTPPVTMQQGGNTRQPIQGTKEQYQAYLK